MVVRLGSDADILQVRRHTRELALKEGFSTMELTVIATAISEIARNILEYAGHGEIHLALVHDSRGRAGLAIEAIDSGPGIPDIALAMQDGYTTGRGLGLGLPGARRLMDEFQIQSVVGSGTVVKMTKWKG